MTMINSLSLQHANDVMKIITAVIEGLKKDNIDQWDEKYPDKQKIIDDISQGSAYGYFENDQIIGYIVLNDIYSPEYGELIWSDNDGKHLIIHRLCVDPNFQRKGIGKQMLAFSENFARTNNYASIRLDAFAQNKKSLSLYENYGYVYVGDVYFRKGKFFCYQKNI
jgi:GNAT superfamily N-acetyltransferase